MSLFQRTAVCALAALAMCQALTPVDPENAVQERRFFGRQFHETVADGHEFARNLHRGPNVPEYERATRPERVCLRGGYCRDGTS